VHEREPAIVGDRLQLVGGAAGEAERLADREVAVAERSLGRQQGEPDGGGLLPQRERRFERADAPPAMRTCRPARRSPAGIGMDEAAFARAETAIRRV
jgi:hypothetical protein